MGSCGSEATRGTYEKHPVEDEGGNQTDLMNKGFGVSRKIHDHSQPWNTVRLEKTEEQ